LLGFCILVDCRNQFGACSSALQVTGKDTSCGKNFAGALLSEVPSFKTISFPMPFKEGYTAFWKSFDYFDVPR